MRNSKDTTRPIRWPSALLTGILAVLISVSPVLAQNRAADLDDAVLKARERVTRQASPAAAQNKTVAAVSTSILTMPSRWTAAESTRPEPAPLIAEPQSDLENPGKTSIIIAALLIGAGATAAILALSGGDDDDPIPVPAFTTIRAGTPRVNSPANP